MKKLKMNAVLYKDMQIQIKKSNTSVIIFVVNIILMLVATVTLITLAENYANGYSVDNRTLIYLFLGLLATESVFIGLMVPAFTAGAISGERERQTMEVLLTTKMSPWEIVKGKYWSSIMRMLLMLVSGLPIFALVFIYGGVSFLQVLMIVGSIITSLMFFAGIGVYFSAVLKKTSSATIMTFLAMGFYMLGTVLLVAIVHAIILSYNEYCYYTLHSVSTYDYYNMGPFVFILYLNPLTTVFEALSRSFGITTDYVGISGMAMILKELRVTKYAETNFFLHFWGIISLAVQMGVTYLHLRLAAKALDPLRTRRNKHAAKGKRQNNT